jgi:hypothetical protein
MTDTTVPYVEQAPGDILTADAWNAMQVKIHDDIQASSQAAAASVTHVANADDAAHLEGKDLAALTAEVTKRVLDDVRGRTGYQQLFKVVKADEPTIIEHGLGTMPLVDLYKLEYFEVACHEDEETRAAFATFYLVNREERRVRVPTASGGRRSIDIQPPDGPDMGIPFADMLTRYKVPYTEATSLDDLETEFWKAFFKAPNDRFNDDQYCHSPWFERCCSEQHSVKRLKDQGDWNDMLFIVQPRKTVNYADTTTPPARFPRPANVFVQHLDNNRTAVWFKPPTPHDQGDEARARAYINDPSSPVIEPDNLSTEGDDIQCRFEHELKLMVLLKV